MTHSVCIPQNSLLTNFSTTSSATPALPLPSFSNRLSRPTTCPHEGRGWLMIHDLISRLFPSSSLHPFVISLCNCCDMLRKRYDFQLFQSGMLLVAFLIFSSVRDPSGGVGGCTSLINNYYIPPITTPGYYGHLNLLLSFLSIL